MIRKISKVIDLLMVCFFIFFMGGEIFACQDYRSVVERMLKQYPESTLQDVYKSFFQDRFGPGHLISDTVAARKYLQQELKEMDGSEMPYYEPAGAGENYYRVNLAVIKEGSIPHCHAGCRPSQHRDVVAAVAESNRWNNPFNSKQYPPLFLQTVFYIDAPLPACPDNPL